MRRLILMLTVMIAVGAVLSRSSYAEIYTTVSGRVTAEDTGKGIAGVTVTIFGGRGDKRAGAMVETDKEGRYLIKDVLSGIHYLSFYPPDNLLYVGDSTRQIEVPKGKHLTNVNQVLKVGGAISGTVYDSDGKTPVSGLKITADCPMATGNDSVGKFADTDGNGQYVMSGFDESDKCTVKIMQPSHYNMERVVSVKKGQTTKVDFIMRWNDNTGISGVVTGADNQPIQWAEIVLSKPFKALYASAYTDAAGRYSIFGVSPGTYKVAAFKAGYAYETKQNIVIEKGKSTEVNFTLLRKQSTLS